MEKTGSRPIEPRILSVGVTGGIASGKSSVCRLFERRGARVIDADRIGREIVEGNDCVLSSLVETFGGDIVSTGRDLNRKALARIVFSDGESLARLNRIVHPFLIEEIRSRIEKTRECGFSGIVVVDAALIFEWNLVEIFDAIVVVSCSEDVQLARMRERDSLEPREALARVRCQIPQAEKIAGADFHIANDGGFGLLERRASEVWDELCKLFAEKSGGEA
ncbi:MAG: dephospho-CoA kinase [Candidatus Eisenbacteria bacterium]